MIPYLSTLVAVGAALVRPERLVAVEVAQTGLGFVDLVKTVAEEERSE
jgi:hypothetical protein